MIKIPKKYGYKFCRIPNSCLCNPREIMVRYVLDHYRSIDDIVGVSINKICREWGYDSKQRHKRAMPYLVRQTLDNMVAVGDVEQMSLSPPDAPVSPMDAKSYECMDFKLAPDFSPADKFTMLEAPVVDWIVHQPSPHLKIPLLSTYLYIRSYIYDNVNNDGSHSPSGFYGDIITMCDTLDMPRIKVDKCIDLLVGAGFYIRHITGSYKYGSQIRNAPNIYVLNDEYADENIKGVEKKLKKQLNVDKFMPVTSAGHKLTKEENNNG